MYFYPRVWRLSDGNKMAAPTGATAAGTAAAPAAPRHPHPPPRQRVALPLHVQKLQGVLNLDRFIDQVERVFNESLENGLRYVHF